MLLATCLWKSFFETGVVGLGLVVGGGRGGQDGGKLYRDSASLNADLGKMAAALDNAINGSAW
jgi:hypothetical protein